jgi:hypothetical protein
VTVLDRRDPNGAVIEYDCWLDGVYFVRNDKILHRWTWGHFRGENSLGYRKGLHRIRHHRFSTRGAIYVDRLFQPSSALPKPVKSEEWTEPSHMVKMQMSEEDLMDFTRLNTDRRELVSCAITAID